MRKSQILGLLLCLLLFQSSRIPTQAGQSPSTAKEMGGYVFDAGLVKAMGLKIDSVFADLYTGFSQMKLSETDLSTAKDSLAQAQSNLRKEMESLGHVKPNYANSAVDKRVVRRVIALNHAYPPELAQMLYAAHLRITAVPAGNKLIIVGNEDEVRSASELIKQIDDPSASMHSVRIKLDLVIYDREGKYKVYTFSTEGVTKENVQNYPLDLNSFVPDSPDNKRVGVSLHSQIDVSNINTDDRVSISGNGLFHTNRPELGGTFQFGTSVILGKPKVLVSQNAYGNGNYLGYEIRITVTPDGGMEKQKPTSIKTH